MTKPSELTVNALMTKAAVSVRASEPLGNAAKLMWDNDCGVIPVLEDESGRVIGVVTDRDICMASWSRDLAPGAMLARDAMSRDLVHCSPEDTIETAAATMRTNQVRRLPVLDSKSNLVGVLSVTDIMRVAGQRSAIRPGFEVSPEQVIDTLAIITGSPLKDGQASAYRQKWR